MFVYSNYCHYVFRISVKTIEEVDKIETDPEDNHHADIPDIRDYRSIFQPRSARKLAYNNLLFKSHVTPSKILL